MDPSAHKLYHVHDFDSRHHLENYLSDKAGVFFGEDFLMFPIENLRKTFILGHIKGDILIDLTIGSLVPHLYAACEFFKHMIVLKIKDRCTLELKRWVDTRTGAFNWCHAAKLHVEMEGNSDQLEAREGKVRSALQHVVKCDLEKENITEPIDLPPADCIITASLLEVISKDQDDYIRYLRKFSKLLKPGGHIILIGIKDATYFTIHREKFHMLRYDEEFARKVLVGEGFVIDRCEVKKRSNVNNLTDYKGMIFIVAHKEK
ncbi:indolethylamine N-methyltransferase-like [Engystomops pustulosus]|uniref:indolethylamine N-methyltransferase-like n=1 Tax=Engystomops pustulosus TaxID=76066 RepID=UPI003AFA3BA1